MASVRLAGVIRESIVDGPGFRFVVFAQGCPHHCPGCHNPDTHDPNGGYDGDTERLFDEFRKNPLLAGITLSGGEPFLQARPLAELAAQVRQTGKNVIVYTGYTIEYLLAHLEEHDAWRALLTETDILIDGPFLEKEKSLMLRFRGSRNQRAIDPRASVSAGRAVEAEL
ncbi:MAG: anaerobic ribonucleoside-triphosphate reductase activating protein [Clostridiales bacterium]|nr:anaerobic ribonucleoside-triphosphate reductase activating protein [Clostridiales bacterium]